MTLENWTIARKLGVGFGCVLLAVALMSGALWNALISLDSVASLNQRTQQLLDDVDLANAAAHEESRASLRFTLLRADRFLGMYNDAVQSFSDHLTAARRNAEGSPEILALLDKADGAGALYRRSVSDEIMRLTRENSTSQLALELANSDRASAILEALKGTIEEARTKVAAKAQETQARFDGIRQFLAVTIALGSLGAVLTALLVGWWMSRIIARPVTAITAVMQKLAAGDNSIEIPGVGRKDEIGHMADAVLVFKKAALKKIQRDADEAEAVKVWQKEEEARSAKLAEEARQDQVAIRSLAEGLERLASGNLAFRIETEFAPKAAQLRSDFNAAVARLQETLASVRSNTDGIASGSGEIASAADDLSRRTEQQAAGLEETAATLDQITATVKNTAEGALRAQTVVSTAKADADRSGEVVREAIAAMGEIEKSSRQIGQIIGVIDEIAFQTNLLALNAGVEAARAGDAGRGFAVVASEVRALAQRSAEAAKEIKSLISASSTQVAQGVDLVGETGKALGRIVTQVAEINTVVASIAASAQEQATALHQVNTAVNQMDQMTQQNAAMVEQTTAAAHALGQESQELARLVSVFEVGAAANIDPVRARMKRVAPPPRAARPALKTLGGHKGGGAVRKADAAPADDSWEEF
ncbi:methyl-accepting chemotaxis sensory transducer [Methylocella silvestris BL2]|uniref:Methyl-accepting chemotaxis sensory transducer n=1 Tax=Methylocella silvestris (strain DSM 15510 / CIP 108128 / LMG 27833 / NCIMB 13906 / BL2) TaxID=395965 RepID=B8ESS8_METSB|nr:methyl-accepting chemotaxis protein [Methylocella silvestris]ACK50413.1 methyl-accepting chemotaxis sensory transducer [Methylocella silvestris BL2]